MTAQEFINKHGDITDPNVRFVKAGNTVVVPLVDLLNEYAVRTVLNVASEPAKKPKKK